MPTAPSARTTARTGAARRAAVTFVSRLAQPPLAAGPGRGRGSAAHVRRDAALLGVDQLDVELHEVPADPFAALEDGLRQRVLVDAGGHRDQLVLAAGDDVVGHEALQPPQLVRPALVDLAHHLVALAGTHAVRPNAHEHAANDVGCRALGARRTPKRPAAAARPVSSWPASRRPPGRAGRC